MDSENQVLEQFAAFMVRKCRHELLDECQPNAPRILNKIGINTLINAFGYHDCPEWKCYIIDLDKEIQPEEFSCENPLYRHTLRIFKTGAENPVFGIEKPIKTHLTSPDLWDTFKQATAFAEQYGIILRYRKNVADDIFFAKENDNVKVKTAFFKLVTSGENNDG